MNVGSHIGQYRILRKIGAGGMGTVYLGEHILLGRRAAIKTLLPALSMQSEIVERFFTEARATSAITDHGVVQIFDFGYHVDGTAYIVMELLEGESLQTRVDRLGQIVPSDALRIARQVAGSLAAAHACDIVHRDLKPENIYLIADGEAQSGERTKILDFGICKLGVAGGDASLTQSGTTMGTPVYMSPEQCRGAGKVDHRSDIYALGCVLFHIVTGRPPFECDGAGEFIVAHLQQEPPTPSSLVPELPELVDGLILRCLEKSADDRFQSMTELQHALEYVLARISSTGIAVPPLAPATPLAPGYRSSHDLNLGLHLGTPMAPQNIASARPGEPSVLVTGDALSAKAAKARRRKSNSSKSAAKHNPTPTPSARGSQPRSISTGAGTPSSVAANGQVMRSGGDWFVSDSSISTPDLGTTTDPRVTSVRPRTKRAVAIVLFGLAAALIATLVMTSGDQAIAGSAPTLETNDTEASEPALEIAATAPDTAAPPSPAPVAPVAIEEATTTQGTLEGSGASPQAATTAAVTRAIDTGASRPKATKKITPKTKARPKAKPPRRPVSRPSITTPKSETVPPEDLYDTR